MKHIVEFCSICLEQPFARSYYEIDEMSESDAQL
jgi:hypothetical protein